MKSRSLGGLLFLLTATGWAADGTKNFDYAELQKAPEKQKSQIEPNAE